MTDTNTDRVEEIEERLAKATPGPWTVDDDGCVWRPGGVPDDRDNICTMETRRNEWPANAVLIGDAPSDLSYLIQETRSFRAKLSALEGLAKGWLENGNMQIVACGAEVLAVIDLAILQT
jgi:hypothetical protein